MSTVSGHTEVDPIVAEIIGHSLRAVTEELEANLARTSFSPLVYEYKDYAIGVVSASGELVCQSQGGLPVFLADIGGPLPSVLEAHPLDSFLPGDAVITNDPAACGQHLNNVNMYMPVFSDDEVIAFVAVRPHWSDVGGKVLGSCLVNDTTEIFQEGIQFPALKLVRGGTMDPHILRLIERNTRLPEIVVGDMLAQLGACTLGVERLGALIEKFGWEQINASIQQRWVQSESLARRRIEALPDGHYRGECWLDNDGVNLDRPVSLNVGVTIAGDSLEIDLSDVSPEVAGSCNAGYAGGGLTVAKVAFKYGVLPDVPADEGCFRPLKLNLPEGRVLSASPSAAKARWNLVTASTIDAILRALSEAMPERATAAHHSGQNSLQFVGRNQDGRPWQHHDTAHGGFGAWRDSDGSGPFKTLSHGDTKDIPLEIVEALYPLTLEHVGLRPDSGGPGRHRGGLGTVRSYRVHADCRLNAAFERTTCPPWGLFGGRPGMVGEVQVVYPNGQRGTFTKADSLPIPAGSIVTFATGGGGGYGDPAERDPNAIARDAAAGYVTHKAAETEYGWVPDATTA